MSRARPTLAGKRALDWSSQNRFSDPSAIGNAIAKRRRISSLCMTSVQEVSIRRLDGVAAHRVRERLTRSGDVLADVVTHVSAHEPK